MRQLGCRWEPGPFHFPDWVKWVSSFPAQAGIHVNVLDFVLSGSPILTTKTNCKLPPHACLIPSFIRPSGLPPSSRDWWDRSLQIQAVSEQGMCKLREPIQHFIPPRGNENKP